jgi:hypothetical protein
VRCGGRWRAALLVAFMPARCLLGFRACRSLRLYRGSVCFLLEEGEHATTTQADKGPREGVSCNVLRKVAIALSVSSDTLVLDAEQDPDEELRLQLEATARFTDGLLLSHEAKLLAA